MSVKFVVSHLDKQLGPFDEQTLKVMWSKGELLPIDYVYDEFKKDWILLAERFEWAAVKAQSSTPPPIGPKTMAKRRRPPEPPSQAAREQADAQITAADVAATAKATELNVELDLDISRVKKPEPVRPDLEVTSIAAAPTPRPTPTPPTSQGSGSSVTLINGVGELDLASMQPGQIELLVKPQEGAPTLEQPLRVNVRASEPEVIVWSLVTQQTVGQDVEIQVKAMDANGHLCMHYDDTFNIQIAAPKSQNHTLALKSGVAKLKLNSTVAETWSLSLHYTGTRKLRLPEAKSFEWQPGTAVKLLLDGPQELTAGDSLKVRIKAVDAYGNLAKTFQGTVVLEVKAS